MALELYPTVRLLVRQLTSEDAEDLFRVYGDAEAMRYVDDGEPIPRADCDRWIAVTHANYERYGYGMSALVLRATGATIGFCGLVHPGGQAEAELKYALARSAWGRGLATEAAGGMIEYGSRSFGLERIIATTAPGNGPSHRVLTKCGMRRIEDRLEDDGSPIWVFAWEAAAEASGNEA